MLNVTYMNIPDVITVESEGVNDPWRNPFHQSRETLFQTYFIHKKYNGI